MSMNTLDFEAPILEIESRIEEIKNVSGLGAGDIDKELKSLTDKLDKLKKDIYKKLTAPQKVLVARHPDRPYTMDYIDSIFTDFVELHGDRLYRDDPAMVCGTAKLNGEPVIVIGHQKGRNTKENIHRNFGMANPEGYRKAQRMFQMAENFNRPIVTFIDTPGAYPGIGAEERGQAEAIAKSLMMMAELTVPMVTIVTGEGGSGGALGIAMGNRVAMLEHSIYAVISPEGCASILWNDAAYAGKAAEALKLTAKDLKELDIIDEIIQEPAGGAHRDYQLTGERVKDFIIRSITDLKKMSREQLFEDRYQKFRNMGIFAE